MSNQNAKNRTPQEKQNRRDNIGNPEGIEGVMGATAAPSRRARTYEIGVGGENSESGYSVIGSGISVHGIPGKILSQLVEELQKQLAYHRQQAEAIEKQIDELIELSESFAEE